MDFLNEINDYCDKLKTTIDDMDKKEINHFAETLLRHYEKQSQIYIFGNGGSGATASHAVCDFNKGVCLDLDKRFRFVCLNDNMATILAYGNDDSYDDIFYLQLKNILSPNDLVIGISGSGNSENVVKAVQYAKEIGADTFTWCGYDGGRLKQINQDNCIHVSINDMQIVEDCHMIIVHMLMQILYKNLNHQ